MDTLAFKTPQSFERPVGDSTLYHEHFIEISTNIVSAFRDMNNNGRNSAGRL